MQTARQLEEVLQDTSLDRKSVLEKMGIDETTSCATAEVNTGTTEVNEKTAKRSVCRPKKKKYDQPKENLPASTCTAVKAAEKEKKRKQQEAILEAANLMTKKIVMEATYLSEKINSNEGQSPATAQGDANFRPVHNQLSNRLSSPSPANTDPCPVSNQAESPNPIVTTDSGHVSNQQYGSPATTNFGPVRNHQTPSPATTVSSSISNRPSQVNTNVGRVTQLSPPANSYSGSDLNNQLSFSTSTANHMSSPAHITLGHVNREEYAPQITQLLPPNNPLSPFTTRSYNATTSQPYGSVMQPYPNYYGVNEVFEDQYETKEQEQEQSAFPDFISSVREASDTINGTVPGLSYQGDECSERCKQRIAALESKIKFLESHLMDSFMDKLVNTVQRCPPALNHETSTAAISGAILVEHNQIENSDLVPLVDGLRPRIRKKQLEAVKRKAGASATSLARHLLMAFFTPDQLAQSSARGSKTRPALDKEIVDAIICFVMQSYPKETERNLIQAINGKCCDTRLTLNLVQKENNKANTGTK